MEQKFYLLATLIEMQDSVSDGHALYRSLDDAMKAFEQEIADCQENFNVRYGSTLIDLPRCKEWRTEDGYESLNAFEYGEEENAITCGNY